MVINNNILSHTENFLKSAFRTVIDEEKKFVKITFMYLSPISIAKPKEEGKSSDEKEVDTTQKDEDTNPKPKALHKTCSIFLRNLAPSITKQEVEAVSIYI